MGKGSVTSGCLFKLARAPQHVVHGVLQTGGAWRCDPVGHVFQWAGMWREIEEPVSTKRRDFSWARVRCRHSCAPGQRVPQQVRPCCSSLTDPALLYVTGPTLPITKWWHQVLSVLQSHATLFLHHRGSTQVPRWRPRRHRLQRLIRSCLGKHKADV